MSTRSKCIGVVREAYNKWERRAPLCPSHVKELTSFGIDVLVQPCNRRVFRNKEYEAAGATITEDLSGANIIVGVKQIPIEELLSKKTYMFFSHTIKAQPENMALLDEILKRGIRLIDYECITEKGKQKGRRLIAFGGYAGRSGMINAFRCIGERLLSLGYSTPFLNIGSAYMYPSLEDAKEAVSRAGRSISRGGISSELAPMAIIFTGNGNVSKGAQEIFRLMPHQLVHPSELSTLKPERNLLYGCVVTEDFLVRHKSDPNCENSVDRLHYYEHPDQYVSRFHEDVAPYASSIVNCMYWDRRYPRILTKSQLNYMNTLGNHKLLSIADISCDVAGSVEFLEKTTSIEKPFFLYNSASDTISDELDGLGVAMMGVDILPSELPKEASYHFGDELTNFVKSLVDTSATTPLDEEVEMSIELKNACITSNGKLTPRYEYIARMRAERERSKQLLISKSQGSTCIHLQGHLFDTGLINKALNLIEDSGGFFYIVDCQVRPNTASDDDNMSTAIVQVTFSTREKMDEAINSIRKLCNDVSESATISELPDYCNGNYSKTLISRMDFESASEKEEAGMTFVDSNDVGVIDEHKNSIVCLGAGLVVSPLLEYLSRDSRNHITVCSSIEGEAKSLVGNVGRINITPETVDVTGDPDKVEKLFQSADCVVSLLPSSMHVPIAKICVKNKIPLVTASYVSPEMESLHGLANHHGVTILCEMGLDPGMDHMSAMKVIDEVKSQGGRITSFSSVCGGLPAPEAADNPLGYKFSWSPKGVLLAAQNAAKFLQDGKIMNISGDSLLSTARRVEFLPAFSLEELPNRNALPYAEKYGIPDAKSVFRGTLRYAGWSQIMYQITQLGFLNSECRRDWPGCWKDLMDELHAKNFSSKLLDTKTRNCLEWLGMYSSEKIKPVNGTMLDTFCNMLQKKLAYSKGERDMALMHHTFGIEFPNGDQQTQTSTYVGYGESDGRTIMAKTVGLTAAIGVELLLEKKILDTGVLIPTKSDIYIPSLLRLEKEGIVFKEKKY